MKMTLNAEDLVVSSFDTATPAAASVAAATNFSCATACFCTDAEGCYPSLYCSQYGPYQHTCAPGCMTNANGDC
jgi:hypothetical protein